MHGGRNVSRLACLTDDPFPSRMLVSPLLNGSACAGASRRGPPVGQITVHSSDDCSQNYTSGDFLSGFGAHSGVSSSWITFLHPSLGISENGEVRADGGGYVGNRNRVVGGVSSFLVEESGARYVRGRAG